MNQRALSSLGLVGIAVVLAAGGFSVKSHGGLVSISLPPATLVAWVFFVLSLASLKVKVSIRGVKNAPWWKKSLSFIYDFFVFFGSLFIPLTFLYLVAGLGGLPSPWLIEEAVVPKGIIIDVIGVVCFIVFWGGMGLALHPNVRTPGMILLNIDLRLEEPASIVRIALFGVFRYYGVFIPLFNVFAQGLTVSGTENDA